MEKMLLDMLDKYIEMDKRRAYDYAELEIRARFPKLPVTSNLMCGQFRDFYEGHLAALQMVKVWIESLSGERKDEQKY